MSPIAGKSLALMLQETAQPYAFFNSTFKLEVLVVVAMIAFFVLVRATLSVEAPGAPQQMMEMLHEFVGGQADQVIGHGYERYMAFITCIFLFVLFNNLLGLIQGLRRRPVLPLCPWASQRCRSSTTIFTACACMVPSST